MASNIACSEELHIENASAALTKLAGLKSVNKPSISVATVDVTTHDDGCVENTRPGLMSLGDISGTIEEVAGGPASTLLAEMATSKAIRGCKIVYGETGGRKEVSFNAFVTELSYGDASEPGANVQVSFTLKPTTRETIADPA
ncbi:phage tail tube protein [Algimonas porphyrae]|uniref:Uncharacterized protein n=1 Tax=Algimonas porphyrae TaxID=1128113 RepID=A0ABQ5V2C8_9PROT|nr:phage tail tube protein [Algimonas porphyrae]GLQ20392.1 hypothetical protein GCM10007854_13470 [Algimonas porphyrae]